MEEGRTIPEEQIGESYRLRVRFFNQDWSGCWGGKVEIEQVSEKEDFLEFLKEKNPWLTEFLDSIGLQQIDVCRIKSPDGGEFLVKPTLIGLEIDISLAVAVIANGVPLWPIRAEKQKEFAGDDKLVGFRLNTSREDPSITFTYLKKEGLFDHVRFGEQGAILVGLYPVLDEEIGRNVDLKVRRPLFLTVVGYGIADN